MNELKEKKKRKTYDMLMVKFEQVDFIDGNFVIPDQLKTNQVSESLYIDILERISVTGFKFEKDQLIPGMFVMKTPALKATKTKLREKYQAILDKGILYKGQRYVMGEESASMTRQIRTLFVHESIAEKMFEYATLGRVPQETIISKYRTSVGVLLSNGILIKGLPKMIVIKDYKCMGKEWVRHVVPYEKDSIMQDLLREEKEREKEWLNKKTTFTKRCEEEPNILDGLDLETGQDTYKTHSSWGKENKRVKIEEIDQPKRKYYYDGKYRPMYSIEQTEDIAGFPSTRDAIGYDVTDAVEKEIEMKPFDGQGLASFKFMERVSKELGISYMTNAIQLRLPFVKGLAIRFDFHSWCEQHGITHIEDIYGKLHKVSDVDVILTESMFKIKHEYRNNENGEKLFDSMDDYYNQLKKYGYTKFAVTNFAK